MVRPAQIRNWRQVSPNGILPPNSPYRRYGVQLHQIRMSDCERKEWGKMSRSYDRYRIAVVPDQPLPILIICDDPGISFVHCQEFWPFWYGLEQK